MAERHRDGLKGLERTFTLIIVLGCAISLYLSTISAPMSPRFGNMGKGYVFYNDKGQAPKGVMGSIFQSHDHRDIFVKNKLKYPNSEDHRVNSTNSTTKLLEDNTEKWFLTRNYTGGVKFDHNHHPYFTNFLKANPGICSHQKVDILIYIQSAIKNFQRRRALRETWANRNTFTDINVRTVFMLGRTGDLTDQLMIENENLAYSDIVQGDFTDTHHNLTLKAIMAARWITQYCAHARYVIKADDDIFINIFLFVEGFIPEIWQQSKSIMCHLKKNGTTPIVRDERSKWFISKDLMPGQNYFPRFCPGYALMFTADLAPVMYAASFTAPFIPVDDVYLFGILLGKDSDVSFTNVQSNFTLNQKMALEEYTGTGPITHAASNAWELGAMEKFWFATLQKLSPWALRHSTYGALEKRRILLKAGVL